MSPLDCPGMNQTPVHYDPLISLTNAELLEWFW